MLTLHVVFDFIKLEGDFEDRCQPFFPRFPFFSERYTLSICYGWHVDDFRMNFSKASHIPLTYIIIL